MKRPVGYKMPGGIQDARWDTKRLVGYKNSGGIYGSSERTLSKQEVRRDLWFLIKTSAIQELRWDRPFL